MTLLEIGRVTRAHGVSGEVVVELVSNRLERLDPGSELLAGTERLRVEGSRRHGARHLVRFAGVADRAAAEALRGRVLVAPPLDDPGAMWVHELVGAKVEEAGGKLVGTVTAVEANPASDLMVLDGGGLVPLRFVTSRSPGLVVVKTPPGLLD